MSQTKIDSKKKNVVEAATNAFGSYPIGLGLSAIILPLSVTWIAESPIVATATITFIYATCSFFRVYFIRRLFTKLGYDDNFIRLAIKLCKRGASIIKSKEVSVNGKTHKTNQH